MKTVAILSGKGGVGKTALACSIASIIAKDEKKVLLFDGNIGLPNCDLYSGVEVGCTIGHVIRDGRELRDAIVPTPAGYDLISGGSGWKELAFITSTQLECLANSLKELSSGYDHVIIDCAPGLSEQIFSFIKVCDSALVIVSGEATSLMDGYAAIKSAWELKPELSAGLLVNQVASSAQGRAIGSQVKGIAGQFLSKELEYWGTVRHDSHVIKSCAERRVFSHSDPLCSASQDLIDAANFIMGVNTTESEEEISMLDKIKSVFGKKSSEGTEELAEAA